jgi:hypothetical protein
MWVEMPSPFRGEGLERVTDTRKTSVLNTLPFIPSLQGRGNSGGTYPKGRGI